MRIFTVFTRSVLRVISAPKRTTVVDILSYGCFYLRLRNRKLFKRHCRTDVKQSNFIQTRTYFYGQEVQIENEGMVH